MNRLIEIYRAMHRQAFMPIFCRDDFDSRAEVEACVAAGCTVIEYTLRKPDAREMIPWVRKNYPDLYLVVGSTLDDDNIVRVMRRRHPQLMTLAELADIGVDGFVSMLRWSVENIRKYSPTHILIPNAATYNEAYEQICAGAHVIKIIGPDLAPIRKARAPAAFDYCPIMVTGGQTLDTIPAAFEAGALMIGTGFDLTLKGRDPDITADEIRVVVENYLRVTQEARAKAWPEAAAADDGPTDAWLDALSHYHPFRA